MKREDLTEKLLDIKREKGWSWKYICQEIGGMSSVMVTGGVLGQQKMTKTMAAAAAKLFGFSKAEEALLNEVPMRGTGTPMPPTRVTADDAWMAACQTVDRRCCEARGEKPPLARLRISQRINCSDALPQVIENGESTSTQCRPVCCWSSAISGQRWE